MFNNETRETIKAIGIGLAAALALGFINIFAGSPDSHTLENQRHAMSLFPTLIVVGIFISLFVGRIRNRY